MKTQPIDNKVLIRVELELVLIRYYPDVYVPQYIKNVHDIYKLRFAIREIQFSSSSFSYLLDTIYEAATNKKRFRTLDCLKVLKRILKEKTSSPPLGSEIKDKLFFLYQQYIFHPNEELQWAVSTFLKDEILNEDQIQWLIKHSDKSAMILNRLLRYPERHQLITSWASHAYKQQKYTDRQSELIALLVDKDIPDYIDALDTRVILWAIHYARVSDETRKELLKQHFGFEELDALIKICTRNDYVDVLEYFHRRIIAS